MVHGPERYSGPSMSAEAGERSQSPPEGETFGNQLELIARMTQDFASSLDIDATLRKALVRITRHVGAEGGAIFLLDDTGAELLCHACDGPVYLTGLRLKASEGVVGRSVRRNACEMVRDTLNDPSFEPRVDQKTGFTTRSILCAPLSVQDQCLGAIELVNKKGGSGLFEERDLYLLQTMASSAALALLNTRFAADLVKQERQRHELEIAAEIQRSLLPQERPPPFPVVGITRPAHLVSGDFFDFLPLPDGRIGFAVGDVSGKGMQAALLMAKTASLYRCLAKTEFAPGRLLTLINQEICETATRGMFVTMIVGVYEPAGGQVRLANAGHEPPLLHGTDGALHAFPAHAPPVGIDPGVGGAAGFPEEDIDLGTAALYIFTDGLTEARTAQGSHLGNERLKQLLLDAASEPLPQRLQSIVDQIAAEPLRDDLTMLVIDGDRARQMAEPSADCPPSGGERILTHRFAAHVDQLKEVRSVVRDTIARLGCSTACVQDVVLAVDEVCQNIIRHAYGGNPTGEIVLEVDRQQNQLVFWIRDFAPKVDEKQIKPRELDDLRPGGLGVHLIREVMDETGFVPCPSGNVFRMVKRLP